jgi:hypothetical protein
MSADTTGQQIREMIGRLIEAGLSVRQFYPSDRAGPGGLRRIGDLASAGSMKNVPYADVYRELDEHDSYHVKLPDGALVTFQYTFSPNDVILKHRLSFFPPQTLPTVEEAPLLYENDELYGDILANRIVRFPIRFDFDPASARQVVHPASHMTVGQFENCRIPVSRPVEPASFVLFLLRNFYFRSYKRNKNLFDRGYKRAAFDVCLEDGERRIPHLVMP